MQNARKRAETLTIRSTKAEKEMIQKKAKKVQLSITDFIVATSLCTEIRVAEDIKPLLIELKRIGNNINQITMKINAGAYYSADFMEVIQGQRHFLRWRELFYRISDDEAGVSQDEWHQLLSLCSVVLARRKHHSAGGSRRCQRVCGARLAGS